VRDLLFTTLFAVMSVLSLRYAHLGVMLWVWSALLPPNSYLYGFGRDIPFNKIAVACTVIGVLIDSRKRIGLDPILLMMALFLLQVSLSLAAAPTPEDWGSDLYERFIKVVIAAFALRFVAIDRARLHAIVIAMALAVATGTLAEAGKVVLSGGGHHTIGPPSWGDENSSATMILMFMPLYLYLGGVAAHPLARRLRLPVFAGGVLAVIGSFSRGGFLGLLALALALLVSARRRVPVIAGLVLLGSLGFLLAPDQWVNRIETTGAAHEDASFMGRVFQWKVLALMALDRPVVGAGMLANMDPSLWLFYADRLESELTFIPAPRSDGPHASHSIYFQVLGETGFVGLGLFLGMFGLGLRAAGTIRAQVIGQPDLLWAGEMAAALRLGLILFLLTGAALPIPYFEPAYLLLAAVSALHSLQKRRRNAG